MKIAGEIYVKNKPCIVEIWRSGTFMENLCKLRLSWAASNNLKCVLSEKLFETFKVPERSGLRQH